jgi:hypothetical protein
MALGSIIALAIAVPILPLIKGAGGILKPNQDRVLPIGLQRAVSRPETHNIQEVGVERPGRMTHAEFVSIIFPAFGLDSRALKTATLEDRIDVLESLDLGPAGGYQPDKTLTVKEASVVLTEIAARFGRSVTSKTLGSQYMKPAQSGGSVEHPRFRYGFRSTQPTGLVSSEADEQPVSPDELAAAIRSDGVQRRAVQVEAQTTTTVTVETEVTLDLSIQTDRIEELKRMLEKRLVEYYNPPYIHPLSPTD